MSKAKDPAFLFYPNDFLAGTIELTDEETGQYIKLLCLQFNNDGYLTERQIDRFTSSPEVKEKFSKNEKGQYFNERLLTVMSQRKERAKKNSANGKKGGNPNFKKGEPNPYYTETDKQKDNQTDNQTDNQKDNQKINIALRNGNGNINEDIIINNTSKVKTKNVYYNNPIVNEAFEELLEQRKANKAKNTERAIKLLQGKLDPFDDDVRLQMINEAIVNNWKSVYPLRGSTNTKGSTKQETMNAIDEALGIRRKIQ